MKRPILLPVTSGILLALCYPLTGWGWLAWFALVPLLVALVGARDGGQALGFGWITGIVFFGGSLHWLTHVAFAGWIFAALMQGAYVMLFAWLAYRGMCSAKPAVFRAVWIALAWTVTEFLRSEMPVFGFGWNLLAYSQSPYLPLIQGANVIGAFGLGFLVALVNALLGHAWSVRKAWKKVFYSVAVAGTIVAGMWVYGARELAKPEAPQEYLRVSVLQGNIPQSVKWALMARDKILTIYERLTQLAALEQPDLIVWPEAAFPGYFNRDLEAAQISQLVREAGSPLLIGGLEWESEKESYNSAYFLNKDGTPGQRYDKLRLVPFGEYIPIKFLFGWLTPVADALGISDFRPGREAVVFRWARENWPFGVLICFEDIFPDLGRDLTDRGAKFLTVITNDAWFGKTGAPFQHLQASIFRAVENGVPVVRAANTGISSFVSSRGRVLAMVTDPGGDATFVTGQKTLDLPLPAGTTHFRQGGFLFPYAAVACFLILGVFLRTRTSK